MKKKRRLIRHSAYSRMFLSLALLTAAVTVVLCMSLFILFSKSTIKDVGEISESMLRQTSYAADIINDQVYEISNHLINNNSIRSVMFSKELDRIKEFEAVSVLRDIQSTYSFIHYIGIYNGITDRYVNNKGYSHSDDQEIIDIIKDSSNSPYIQYIPRKIIDPGSGSTYNVLTIVLRPGVTSFMPQKGAITINIDAQYIQSLIGSMKNTRSQNIMVLDSEGVVLSDVSGSQFNQSLSEESYINRILNSEANSGSFVEKVDGEKSQISFVKSPRLKWVFVSVSRYKDLIDNINMLKVTTLIIAGATIIISILASIWLSNQMYNPIKKLMDKIVRMNVSKQVKSNQEHEFSYLDQIYSTINEQVTQLEPALELVKKSHLFRYLNGSQVDLVNRYYETLEGPYFVSVVMMLDEVRAFKAMHDVKQRSIIQYGVYNIAQEIMANFHHAEVVVISDEEFAILGSIEKPQYGPELLVLLDQIQSNIKHFFHISMTISIGPVVKGSDQIRQSYLIAKETSHNRFFEGNGRIFEYGDYHIDDEEVEYPASIEKQLIESIQSTNRDQILETLDSFMNSIGSGNYHQALFTTNQLLVSLYNHFTEMSYLSSEESGRFRQIAYDLSTYETISELKADLYQVCMSICNQIEEKTNNRNAQLIQSVMSFVSANYAVHDLSLEMLAQQVQLTPGYLGKLFKLHNNMSFNDYLKQIRLEKSKELLAETTASTQSISEQVGILNTTYFYTLFKKKYGISPAQYRSECLLNQHKDA
ncbi:AraC family transcriptional regulator [Paenibacillus marinisediminis]